MMDLPLPPPRPGPAGGPPLPGSSRTAPRPAAVGALGPLSVPPLRLAAMARQGSAAALRLLAARCQEGPPEGRVAALRLLPGLIPFQPVGPILEEVDRPGAPPAVRRAVTKVRGLLDDPRDCEGVYRAVQRALGEGFAEAERQAQQTQQASGGRRALIARREELRLSRRVVAALYDYRFEMSDGCLGDLQDRHVQEFLLEYAPRRLLLSRPDRPKVPRVLVRHVSWLRRIGHLLPRRAHRLCILALQLLPQYLEAAQAPSQPGSARAALRGALSEGVDLGDEGALGRYLTLHALDLHEELAPVFPWPL
jgi:hypothetical protein